MKTSPQRSDSGSSSSGNSFVYDSSDDEPTYEEHTDNLVADYRKNFLARNKESFDFPQFASDIYEDIQFAITDWKNGWEKLYERDYLSLFVRTVGQDYINAYPYKDLRRNIIIMFADERDKQFQKHMLDHFENLVFPHFKPQLQHERTALLRLWADNRSLFGRNYEHCKEQMLVELTVTQDIKLRAEIMQVLIDRYCPEYRAEFSQDAAEILNHGLPQLDNATNKRLVGEVLQQMSVGHERILGAVGNVNAQVAHTQAGVQTLQVGQDRLHHRVGHAEQSVRAIRHDVAQTRSNVQRQGYEQAELRGRLNKTDGRVDRLDRQVAGHASQLRAQDIEKLFLQQQQATERQVMANPVTRAFYSTLMNELQATELQLLLTRHGKNKLTRKGGKFRKVAKYIYSVSAFIPYASGAFLPIYAGTIFVSWLMHSSESKMLKSIQLFNVTDMLPASKQFALHLAVQYHPTFIYNHFNESNAKDAAKYVANLLYSIRTGECCPRQETDETLFEYMNRLYLTMSKSMLLTGFKHAEYTKVKNTNKQSCTLPKILVGTAICDMANHSNTYVIPSVANTESKYQRDAIHDATKYGARMMSLQAARQLLEVDQEFAQIELAQNQADYIDVSEASKKPVEQAQEPYAAVSGFPASQQQPNVTTPHQPQRYYPNRVAATRGGHPGFLHHQASDHHQQPYGRMPAPPPTAGQAVRMPPEPYAVAAPQSTQSSSPPRA